jgi:hypothetical protein
MFLHVHVAFAHAVTWRRRAQALGCLLPDPALFRLATGQPPCLPDARQAATLAEGGADSPAAAAVAPRLPAPPPLVSGLCGLALRRCAPRPDASRDGSGNGQLDEAAVDQRLLGPIAAAHRLCREVLARGLCSLLESCSRVLPLSLSLSVLF